GIGAVGQGVAVVVDAVTDLGAGRRALVLAAVAAQAVGVDPAGQGGEDAADAGLADRHRVRQVAHPAALAAVLLVGVEVEAVVDGAVAVVVFAVADLAGRCDVVQTARRAEVARHLAHRALADAALRVVAAVVAEPDDRQLVDVAVAVVVVAVAQLLVERRVVRAGVLAA